MLQQTQVPRVADVWPRVHGPVPDPEAMAARRTRRGDHRVGPARVPAPGPPAVGGRDDRSPSTAGPTTSPSCPASVATPPARSLAQADDVDVPAIEVNIRRVVERVRGRGCSRPAKPRRETVTARPRPLRGRDRLLALMDVGATAVPAARPALRRVPAAPTVRDARARSPTERTPPPDAVRGIVPPAPRPGDGAAARPACRSPVDELDAEALASLVADGLAVVAPRPRAALALSRQRVPARAQTRDGAEEVARAGRGPAR